jgi:hypothetical protein
MKSTELTKVCSMRAARHASPGYRTRREYVHVGSYRPSMASTVPHPGLAYRTSIERSKEKAVEASGAHFNSARAPSLVPGGFWAGVKPAEWRLVFWGWRAMDGPESPAEHGCESGRAPENQPERGKPQAGRPVCAKTSGHKAKWNRTELNSNQTNKQTRFTLTTKQTDQRTTT